MLKLEKKLFAWAEKQEQILLTGLICVLALVIRVKVFNFSTGDINLCLLPWMQQLKEMGGILALRYSVGEYNIPYTAMLAVLSYLPRELWMYAIKTLSVIFDFVCAGCVVALAQQFACGKKQKLLLLGTILLGPAVIINGAMWGQCDSIYTAFLLLTLLAICKNKWGWAWFFWGWALGFKLQAMFYLPAMLIVYAVNQTSTILYALAAPVAYLMGILPAWILGRPLKSILGIYFAQTNLYPQLTLSMPNIYSWFNVRIPEDDIFPTFGTLFTLILLLGLAMWLYVAHRPLNRSKIILLFAVCGEICNFFLPHMHQRYNYPVYFFLAVLMVVWQTSGWLTVLVGINTMVSYIPYLLSCEEKNAAAWAAVNFVVLLVCVRRLLQTDPLPDVALHATEKELTYAVQ